MNDCRIAGRPYGISEEVNMSDLMQMVADLEAARAVLFLKDEGVGLRFPECQREHLRPLLSRIREHKAEVADYLRVRNALPPNVRLVAWEPKVPPIKLTPCLTVIDVVAFAISKLWQLKAALEGKNWIAGNWSVAQLLEWLEGVGLKVDLQAASRAVREKRCSRD